MQTSLDGPASPSFACFGSLNFKKPSPETADEMFSPLNVICFIFEFLLNLKLELDWMILRGIVMTSWILAMDCAGSSDTVNAWWIREFDANAEETITKQEKQIKR